MNGPDLAIFRWINSWPQSQAPFWVFLTEATKRPSGLILLGLISLVLLSLKSTRLSTIVALLSWPVANAMTDILKATIHFQRPSSLDNRILYPEFIFRVEPLTSYGTASAHSANMMAVATVFLWWNRRIGYAWLTVALLVGLSRIYVGVHWPSQVMIGWICGLFCGTVIVKTTESLMKMREKKLSPIPAEPVEVP